ncbi:MAG: hypothetical protein AAB445_03185 [Patescibacteria group bacterium]
MESMFDHKVNYGSPVVLALSFVFVFFLGLFFIWAIGNATDSIGPNLAAFKDKDAQAQSAVYTNGAWAASKGCLVAFVQADNASSFANTKNTAAQKVAEVVAKYDATKLQALNTKVVSCAAQSIPASWGGAIYVNVTKTGSADFSVESIATLLAS